MANKFDIISCDLKIYDPNMERTEIQGHKLVSIIPFDYKIVIGFVIDDNKIAQLEFNEESATILRKKLETFING